MLYLTSHQNLKKSGFNIQRPYNKCSRIVSISRCFLILSWILDQLFSHRSHSSPAAQKCIFKIRTARRCISTYFLTSMAAIPIGKININSLLLIFIQLSVFVKKCCRSKTRFENIQGNLVCHMFLASRPTVGFCQNSILTMKSNLQHLKALDLLFCTKASSNFFRLLPVLGWNGLAWKMAGALIYN